jgi:cytochrome c oxidase subunit 3
MFLKSLYTQRHAFHMVDPSIMPFITAISALMLTSGSVLFFHGFTGGSTMVFFALFFLVSCKFLW